MPMLNKNTWITVATGGPKVGNVAKIAQQVLVVLVRLELIGTDYHPAS